MSRTAIAIAAALSGLAATASTFAATPLSVRDSWRIGNSWADDGPQAGYFPFYLALLMGAASIFGLVSSFVSRGVSAEALPSLAEIAAADPSAAVRAAARTLLPKDAATVALPPLPGSTSLNPKAN